MKRIPIPVILLLLAATTAARADDSSAANCADYERSAAERIADCSEALAVPENDPMQKARMLAFRGWAHIDRAEYVEAEADFTATVSEASFMQRMMANMLAAAKDPEAVDLTMPFGSALIGRSWTDAILGKYDEAIADAELAAKWFQSPARDSDAEGMVAYVARLRGDPVAAEADYQKAEEIYASNPYNKFAHATLLFELGRDAEALPLLRDSVRLSSDYGYPNLWLYIHSDDREGEGRRAIQDYADDAKIWPEPIARYYLGGISANELLREAEGPTPAKAKENLCEAHYYIAEALRLAGKLEEARPHYQAAIDTGVTWYIEYAAAQTWLTKN